jgi:hypothetical protein
LTYSELNNFLSLRFINQAAPRSSTSDSTCDTEQKVIAGLDAAALTVCTFSPAEKPIKQEILDRAIMQAKPGNGKLMIICSSLSQLPALQKATESNWKSSLVLWRNTTCHTERSKALYQTVSKATTGFLDETPLPEKVDGNNFRRSQGKFAACLSWS